MIVSKDIKQIYNVKFPCHLKHLHCFEHLHDLSLILYSVTLLYYIMVFMCVSVVNVQISSILSDEKRLSFLNKCMKH